MEFFQLLFVSVYLGTPLLATVWAVALGRQQRRKPMWLVLSALGLWLLQAFVVAVFVVGCLGGHCRPSTFEEYAPYVAMGLAYLGIIILFALASRASSQAEQPL